MSKITDLKSEVNRAEEIKSAEANLRNLKQGGAKTKVSFLTNKQAQEVIQNQAQEIETLQERLKTKKPATQANHRPSTTTTPSKATTATPAKLAAKPAEATGLQRAIQIHRAASAGVIVKSNHTAPETTGLARAIQIHKSKK
jgi:hypothetical protein